jgi:hypothetical protein
MGCLPVAPPNSATFRCRDPPHRIAPSNLARNQRPLGPKGNPELFYFC